MARNRRIRKMRGSRWTAESSAAANRARWAADRARRNAEEPERLAEMATHPPVSQGDAIAVLEWRDLRSGEVRRWTVLRGDRVDRVMLAARDGRRTGSHGWTWILDHLRGYLAGTKG